MADNIIAQTKQQMSSVYNLSTLNPEKTYSSIIRDTFYQLVPTDFKQYYFRNVRLCLNYYQGYVPNFHSPAKGIFSTRIGNSIVKTLTKLIVGGKVFFINKYKEQNPKNLDNESLNKLNVWSLEYKFQSFIKKLVEYELAGGTIAIVYAINSRMDFVPKIFRIDQFFYTADFNGVVESFTGFIKSYTADIDMGNGRQKETRHYYLLEKRYYNDKGEPIIKIAVKYAVSNVTSAQEFNASSYGDLEWEKLPTQIKKRIKNDYGNSFMINKEEKLPKVFKGLGVEIGKFTNTNSIPEVDLGESVLNNVIAYLMGYEQAYSEMVTDLYLGRGKVLLPQQFNNSSDEFNGFYANFDKLLYTAYPYMGDKEQKPESVQFELRAKEWEKIRNMYCELIASNINVSGNDLFPFLKDGNGSSKTATQISSESQSTIAFVGDARVNLKELLDKVLLIWKDFYKVPDYVGVEFSSQNHINLLVTTEQVRVISEVGFPYYDIYHKMFPDLDTAQLNEMVERKYEQLMLESKIKAKSKGITENKDKNDDSTLTQAEKQDKAKDNNDL